MSLKDYADATGESLSSVKRQSINEPHTLRLKIDALMSTQPQQEASSSSDEYEEVVPVAEYDELHEIIVCIYFAALRIVGEDASLKAKLRPILNVLGSYIDSLPSSR